MVLQTLSYWMPKILGLQQMGIEIGDATEEWVQWVQGQAPQRLSLALEVTTLLLLVITLIIIWWHHPLYGKNAGPKVYPLVGNFLSFLRNSHQMLDYLTKEIHKSPTHTVRFVRPGLRGQVMYNTANVANVEYILKTRFENYPKGDFQRDVLGDLLGKGIFNADGDLWKLQRKLASHEFTSRSLREFGFECAQRELEDRLVPFLFRACEKPDNVVDLQDLLLRFSFDSICLFGFGVDPNCLELSLPTVQVAVAFDKALECIARRYQTLIPVIMSVKKFFNIGDERELKEAMTVVNGFAEGVIRARRKELYGSQGKKLLARHDLLSRFMEFTESSDHGEVLQSELEQRCMDDLNLNASDPIAKEQASNVFLRDMVISFILAGRDTSSLGLTWFFHALSNNPHVEAKIYDEIKQRLQARQSSQQNDHPPLPRHSFSLEELKQLQYLHAAIHESLRLFPPVPLDPKEAAGDDVLPDGSSLRKGDRIMYNIFAMARMETIWGPDCNEFKPERWLKDGMFVSESLFKFATFQAGPRICLGKELALVQMKLVASSLIYHFKFTAMQMNPPVTLHSLVLRMVDGFHVLVHSRIHDHSIEFQ
ncbi:hypothetical protein KC19_2G070000 [Ceratodon purpureus]|uniref:Cytochrome P450 n=1 Tax=Ceratodon purpureus TaxID=3225 RepID=A0A8T0IR16_CERPU|nr:hypothetical protein KC19_2G070000 [Ceratodon purpureus]